MSRRYTPETFPESQSIGNYIVVIQLAQVLKIIYLNENSMFA